MQCYCGAGEDYLPFLYRDQSIKVENEYYIVKYANYADWYNVIILFMKDNWLLAISYKIFL